MSETKTEIDAAASAAVEDAADAQAAQSVAVAGAADAVATAAVADASQSSVAAATGAAALAEVNAAKTIQAAAEEIAETKGELAWLKQHTELTASSLQSQSAQIAEIQQKEIPAIVGMLSKMSEALQRLTPQNLPPVEPGQETQIVDPAQQSPSNGGAAIGVQEKGKDKKSPKSKARVWTTGRRA